MIFHNFAELQTYCEQHGITLAQAFIGQETANSGITTAELYEHMEEQLNVMEASVERGKAGVISHSGMSGLDAMKMAQSGKPKLAGAAFFTALTNAIAVNEVNAAMGVIDHRPVRARDRSRPDPRSAADKLECAQRSSMTSFCF